MRGTKRRLAPQRSHAQQNTAATRVVDGPTTSDVASGKSVYTARLIAELGGSKTDIPDLCDEGRQTHGRASRCGQCCESSGRGRQSDQAAGQRSRAAPETSTNHEARVLCARPTAQAAFAKAAPAIKEKSRLSAWPLAPCSPLLRAVLRSSMPEASQAIEMPSAPLSIPMPFYIRARCPRDREFCLGLFTYTTSLHTTAATTL